MNTRTNQLTPCRIDDVVKNQTVNDIFAIHKNDEGYWFGTSFGLTRLYQGEYRVYNETDGFPNNTIHGILEGRGNNLWLSTNQGWCGSMFARIQYRPTASKVTWK